MSKCSEIGWGNSKPETLSRECNLRQMEQNYVLQTLVREEGQKQSKEEEKNQVEMYERRVTQTHYKVSGKLMPRMK